MGPTLDSLDSLESLDALDAEAPEGRGGGGPGSNVLGALCDALDSLDSDQGPNLTKLMNRKWHPGLSIQTPPPPIEVPLNLLNLMDLTHLKSWPWGRLSMH